MDTPRRGKPYFWVTWLAGLVAGEKSCAWAAWYRGHFEYAKRPDDRENTLLAWKAEHAAAVQAEAQHMEAAGLAVSREDQNKFTYRGKVALVGGKPDLIGLEPNVGARVVDLKTGRERDADVVQVAIYMLLAGTDLRWLADLPLAGEVVYPTRRRLLTAQDAAALRPRIIEQVLAVAGELEPARVPSRAECRYCDILYCPDRETGDDASLSDAPVEGAIF